jgi:hypothetical protein
MEEVRFQILGGRGDPLITATTLRLIESAVTLPKFGW